MGLKVIGAGLPRTGTSSLKIALQMLLNAPCYHMSELHEHLEHSKFWHAAAKGELTSWDDLFSGYCAAVDAPTCFFWRELMQAYPEAIVVLSVRDADAWFESCAQTIFREGPPPGARRLPNDPANTTLRPPPDRLTELRRNPLSDPALRARLPFTRGAGKDATIRKYEEHNSAVRAEVPPQRLLVWKPEDGWAPLCAALRIPIPDIPFPHFNTRRTFRHRRFLEVLLGRRLADKTVRFMEIQRERLRHARGP